MSQISGKNGDFRMQDVDGIMSSLIFASMLHGIFDARVLKSRDETIMCCLSAAISFAIETGGSGDELKSLGHVRGILDSLDAAYRSAIASGECQGRTKGGFDRR